MQHLRRTEERPDHHTQNSGELDVHTSLDHTSFYTQVSEPYTMSVCVLKVESLVFFKVLVILGHELFLCLNIPRVVVTDEKNKKRRNLEVHHRV